MSHRILARAARSAPTPAIERDPAIVTSFLSDAAHVPGGFASGVTMPATEAEVSALLTAARHVLPVGAQSSLTGGATPRGEIVLSTRGLASLMPAVDGTVRAGAGVPLAVLQRTLAASGLYYPPVPTYDGAFVGGTIATNAAGAATFKYGSTRPWVSALTIVLASGEVLDVRRGSVTASPEGWFEIERTSGAIVRVPVPSYTMPAVRKLSAGYFAQPGMDLIDLFIGSEGTLGVIVDAEVRVIARPRRAVALVCCDGEAHALAVTTALRERAPHAAPPHDALDISAVEYMDWRSLRVVPDDACSRARIARPAPGSELLLVQIELMREGDEDLAILGDVLGSAGVGADPVVAMPGDERGAERLFGLREAVPASVNARVALAKAAVHPDIRKTAVDPIVPVTRLAESLALYRAAFERRGLDYAVWGHLSDGNLHPNVIPRTIADVELGDEAIREIASGVIALGGSPLAEHGVGRSLLKQQLLHALYGDAGLAGMRAVKDALDPGGKLAPGVLFPACGDIP